MSLRAKLSEYLSQRKLDNEVFGTETLRQARRFIVVGDDGSTEYTPEFMEWLRELEMPWRLHALILRGNPALRQHLREWLWDHTTPEARQQLGWEKWW